MRLASSLVSTHALKHNHHTLHPPLAHHSHIQPITTGCTLLTTHKAFLRTNAPRISSTLTPEQEHSAGFYSFFTALESGCRDIRWPKREEVKFNNDFMEGFKYIPNYLTQAEHDHFLKECMQYGSTSENVRHFDGRLALCGMETDFYDLFFGKLKKDGLMDTPEKLPPNIYASGDGIPAHFDNIVQVRGVVCSIGLGGSDIIKFKHMPTGRVKEVVVEPRSLYIQANNSRYNCVHMIDPKTRVDPRVSVVAVEMIRPYLTDPTLDLIDYRDFVMMGSYGVWRHLDEVRGYTTLRQKADILRALASTHFPAQLKYFDSRFAELAEFAETNKL